jgi:putative ABC transport system permease protein
MAISLFDLRDAARGLRHDGGYATTVVLTLALTVGATTAVFSIVDGVLLKPLAYRESHRLVEVNEVWRQLASEAPALPVNAQHFEYWRAHAQTFESMAQYATVPANLTGAGEAAQITIARASGSVFHVLQVLPEAGRVLSPEDERAGSPDVAVISDAMWRTRLKGDRAIVGRALTLDGRPHTIVGVLPPDFALPLASRLSHAVDAFVPLKPDVQRVGWVGDHNNFAVGRLKPGVTAQRARAELDALQAQVSVRASADAGEAVSLSATVTPLTETIVGSARQGLLLLLGAIAAVLLIACSNLANLSLTRALARLRDAAVRAALGASRSRLVAHACLEQLVLSMAGGALGVLVASAALRLFVKTAPVDLPRASEVTIDARVLLFAAAISIAAALVIAALPAWRLGRRDLQDRLRASALSLTSDRGGLRARGVLLALQVALSTTLLVVTTLLCASFVRLMEVDRGFESSRVLAVPIAMPANRYATEAARVPAYDRLIAAVHSLPGVRAVSTTSMLPLSGEGQTNFIVPEGRPMPRAEQPTANFRFVAPEYFSTLRIRLRAGRSFTDTERAADRPAPAVVSQSTAARLWPNERALGKRFNRGLAEEQGFEVVGVAEDARTTSLDRVPPMMVYAPYWWRSRAATSLLIATASDPAALMPAVRRAIAQVDPEIAVGDARTLDRIVDSALAPRRYQMRLFVAFGAVALVIAVLGVYAVTSYGVSRRRREINIRVALGARLDQVLALVLRQSVMPIVVGLAVGVAGAFAIGGLVASLLFGVEPRNPLVIAGVAAVVGGIGVVAAAAAGRRNLVIDPAAALRQE